MKLTTLLFLSFIIYTLACSKCNSKNTNQKQLHEDNRKIDKRSIEQLSWSSFIVTIDAVATPTEQFAAQELAYWLGKLAGVVIPISSPTNNTVPQIAVGPIASIYIKAITFDQIRDLGPESFIRAWIGNSMAISGGFDQPRGTVYGVYHFLNALGIRWLATNATHLPSTVTLTPMNFTSMISYTPSFEYRDIGERSSELDPYWSVRNFVNGGRSTIPPQMGGHWKYPSFDMFVHTYYQIVPPDVWFPIHPEWFSLINGKRVGSDAQLCLTNSSLLQFVISQVKQMLVNDSAITMISISQNDNGGPCQCQYCRALENLNGGQHSGPVLWFANQVADAIAAQYPQVLITTLAYQYTLTPPTVETARPNVRVRMSDISCNWAYPLWDPNNGNGTDCEYFINALQSWNQIVSGHLYVWTYITCFGYYVLPWPNTYVQSSNTNWLLSQGVVGIYQEGNYQSLGGYNEYINSYVLAQYMFNNSRSYDDIVYEFYTLYYSQQATPYIQAYQSLLYSNVVSQDGGLWLWSSPQSGFLNDNVLWTSFFLIKQARLAAPGPQYQSRIDLVKLSLYFVAMIRWQDLCSYAQQNNLEWPMENNINDAFNWFSQIFNQWGILTLRESANPPTPDNAFGLQWYSTQMITLNQTCSSTGQPFLKTADNLKLFKQFKINFKNL